MEELHDHLEEKSLQVKVLARFLGRIMVDFGFPVMARYVEELDDTPMIEVELEDDRWIIRISEESRAEMEKRDLILRIAKVMGNVGES